MKPFYKRLVILALVILVVFSFRFTPLAHFFTLEKINEYKELFKFYVEHHLVLSLFIYTLAYVGTVALALPGAAIITMLGGYLFGVLTGCIVVNVGATSGAAINFLVARAFLGEQVQREYRLQLAEFNENLKRNGVFYLLSLRLMAVVPFFLINLLAGLTNVSLSTFLWTTSVGIIPGSLVFLYAGQQLGFISSVSEVFTGNVLLAFVLLGALALVPVGVRMLRGWGA